jgi:hypothetical protein
MAGALAGISILGSGLAMADAGRRPGQLRRVADHAQVI